MVLSRIKLINFIGMYIAQHCESFEIKMDNQYPMTLIRGSNGYGKAQPVTTIIPTPDGCKILHDLEVGDAIFDREGKPTTVTGIYEQGVKDVYQITFSDGRRTMCCKEHLWHITDEKKKKSSICELQSIMDNWTGDQRRYRIPMNGPVQFNPKPVPVDPWVVGFYLRYGIPTEDRLTIRFRSSTQGMARTSNPAERIASQYKLKYYVGASEDGVFDRYIFGISTKDFFKDLPEVIDPIPFIPEQYLYNSEDVRMELLQGFAEPNVSNLRKDIPKHIISQINSIRFSLGHECRFGYDDYTGTLYPIDSDGVYISDITYRGQMNCKCIMVDNPEHLYLTNDYIVTHNTVLLSAMSSPFAYDGGVDNRSSTDIIRPGYTGEKEMEYRDGNDLYLIKHIYKPTQTGHSVKSYISRNGIELNPNGNVSSFTEIIHSVFGITEKDLMLLRLGTNATSFISLSSMERKRYLSRIIGDIDIYMQLFNMIQSDIRLNKGIIASYTEEIAKLHIEDAELLTEQTIAGKERIEQMLIEIGNYQKELKQLRSSTIDIPAISQERSEMLEKVSFASTIDDSIKKLSVDKLKSSRRQLESEHDTEQTKVNQIKATIDSNQRSIQYAKMDLSKLTVDTSLGEKIESLSKEISDLSAQYKGFKYIISSMDYANLYQDINTVRTILTMIVGYEPTIVNEAIRLYQKKQDVDQWVDKNLTNIINPDSKLELAQHLQMLIKDGYHVPDCGDVNCAYRKMGEMISTSENTDTITVEFIKSVRSAYRELITVFNTLNKIPKTIPKELVHLLQEDTIIKDLQEGKVFSIDLFNTYRSAIYGFESYQQKLVQLNAYRDQEKSRQDIIGMMEAATDRIKKLEKENESLYTQLSSHSSRLDQLKSDLNEIDIQIGKRIEYDAIRDLIPSYTKRIQEIDKQIEEHSTQQTKISLLQQQIAMLDENVRELQDVVTKNDTRLALYEKYQSDIVRINRLVIELNKILRNVSAKDKGIPILYMRTFFDKIRVKCNELLDISFDGNLKIGEFDLSSPAFDIPYIRNGSKIQDVRFASQGEQPVISIAISFAMSSLMSNKRYNILCCDELDGPLDYSKKARYPDILEQHISTMGIDQCFVISHSEVFDSIPTNLIDMEENLPPIQDSNPYRIEKI